MKSVLILTLLFAAITAMAADINGKWKATVEGRDGPIEVEYNFTVADGKLTGTVTGPMGEAVITDGTVKDDEVSFAIAAGERSIAHKGKVAGDEMTLTVEFGERQVEFTAKRVKP